MLSSNISAGKPQKWKQQVGSKEELIRKQQTLSGWCLPCFEPIGRWLRRLIVILQCHAEQKRWPQLCVFTAQQGTPTRILQGTMMKQYSCHRRSDITFIKYRRHHETIAFAQRGGGRDHLFEFLYRAKVQDDVAYTFVLLCHRISSKALKFDGRSLKPGICRHAWQLQTRN